MRHSGLVFFEGSHCLPGSFCFAFYTFRITGTTLDFFSVFKIDASLRPCNLEIQQKIYVRFLLLRSVAGLEDVIRRYILLSLGSAFSFSHVLVHRVDCLRFSFFLWSRGWTCTKGKAMRRKRVLLFFFLAPTKSENIFLSATEDGWTSRLLCLRLFFSYF